MIRITLPIACAALAVALFPASVSAHSAGAFMTNPAFRDPPPRRCDTTVDMQHCAAHDLRVADARMSARYHALRARLRPAARQALLDEQRAWLRRRDRDCIAKGERYRGGSLASVAVAQCWVEVTRTREKALVARR